MSPEHTVTCRNTLRTAVLFRLVRVRSRRRVYARPGRAVRRTPTYHIVPQALAAQGAATGAAERAPAPHRMKILIISFFFPPYNVIGAVRLGKTAKYLLRMGYDVRVLAAAEIPEPPTLALEIPASRVIYTPWFDIDRPYKFVLGLWHTVRSRLRTDRVGTSGDLPASGSASPRAADDPRRLKGRGVGGLLRLMYTDLFHWPDAALGWRRYATPAGRAMVKGWKPDVILASGTPWTSFLVARDSRWRSRPFRQRRRFCVSLALAVGAAAPIHH